MTTVVGCGLRPSSQSKRPTNISKAFSSLSFIVLNKEALERNSCVLATSQTGQLINHILVYIYGSHMDQGHRNNRVYRTWEIVLLD